jgi:AraC-like DNA-binding protein
MPPVMNGNNTNSADVRERLSRARKFIDESYQLPLDLIQISRQACLSRYHFPRLFRDALIQRRIEKAKELLRSRRLSITDVCFEVGFESLGSFSSLFRKRVGQPPATYRRRERESLKKIPGCFIQIFRLPRPD